MFKNKWNDHVVGSPVSVCDQESCNDSRIHFAIKQINDKNPRRYKEATSLCI